MVAGLACQISAARGLLTTPVALLRSSRSPSVLLKVGEMCHSSCTNRPIREPEPEMRTLFAGLAASSSYATARVRELAVLCDSSVRAAVEREGVSLVTFSEL